MAYQCKMMSKECDGCGACEEKPVMEDDYGTPIYEGDRYYDIDGEIVCRENLWKWAEEYEQCASR